ncbi:MAG: DUF4270 domain-containing protein [Prevotellaceae bacterium]|jgi:hypothetical protein|nr:DUF4270 domain-containing protein [Prevotellaceae bacterium]
MNIPYLKVVLATAAICALHACVEVDNTLGLDYVPDDQLFDVQQKEFRIPLYTATMDSVVTSTVAYGAVGFVNNNPPFGTFTAGAVFRILPYDITFTYPEHAQADSATLTLVVYANTKVGNDAVAQPLALHRLTRSLQYSTSYYNNSLKSGDYGSVLSQPYVYRGEDTINLRIDPAYAQELIAFLSDSTQTTTDTMFLDTFKGLYLAADTSTAAGAAPCGQINYIDWASVRLTVHYKTADTTATEYYDVESSTANFNVFTHGSAPLANAAYPLPAPAGSVYLEGLAGVKPYIDFAAVKDTLTQWMQREAIDTSQFAIHKAELLLYIDYPQTSLDLLPDLLTLAYKDDSQDTVSVYTYLTDTFLGIFDGALNRSLQQYSFNITYYTQGLFLHTDDTERTPHQFYICPLHKSYDDYGSLVVMLERTQYYAGILKGQDGNGVPSVKFKLTYTKLPSKK